MPQTKAKQTFDNRLAHALADVEVADVIGRSASLLSARHKDTRLFDCVKAKKHPTLARRKATDHGRQLAISHLKATLGASVIKTLYEERGMSRRLLIIDREAAGTSA